MSVKYMKVAWGKISMVDAEKRLLANALQDTDNQHFVLLSDRCLDWEPTEILCQLLCLFLNPE